MKKRFIVCTNPTTTEEDKLFNLWIAAQFGWWQWLNQTWLLVDVTGTYTADLIRDKVMEFFPNRYSIVIELRSDGTDTWAGFGPSLKEKNMFTWIRNNWNR